MITAEKKNAKQRRKEILMVIQKNYGDSLLEAPDNLIKELRQLSDTNFNKNDSKSLQKKAKKMLWAGISVKEVAKKIHKSKTWVRDLSKTIVRPPKFRYRIVDQTDTSKPNIYFSTKEDFKKWCTLNEINWKSIIHRKTGLMLIKYELHWFEIPLGSLIVCKDSLKVIQKQKEDFSEYEENFAEQ